jgi:hypothetical protein
MVRSVGDHEVCLAAKIRGLNRTQRRIGATSGTPRFGYDREKPMIFGIGRTGNAEEALVEPPRHRVFPIDPGLRPSPQCCLGPWTFPDFFS